MERDHTAAVSRRQFIATLAAAAPLLSAARLAGAAALEPRELRFSHTHTGERLAIEYFRNGTYLPDALSSVDQFLRDFRTGEIHVIDPRLLDLLHGLTSLTGSTRPYAVISGYRSPATNLLLRRQSEGVAAHSLHMQGQAIDIRLPGVPLATLRKAALSLGRGGVGYYPASDFVHVDTGRVRAW